MYIKKMMVIMTTIPCLLLFLLLIQQVHFSISASPGDLYINGVVYNTNADITLYNGGSLSIQATNSHYMCILLMSKDGDWTDAAPECTWNSGGTSIICKYGDKYTYSQGLEPTFTPASQSEKTTLKVQACGASSLYDTHGETREKNEYESK